MSDEKPFAEVVPKVPPHRWACDVEIAGQRFGGRGLNRTTAASRVDNIRAAVAARERKAAAQALREAADTVLDTHDGPAFRMIGSLDDGTENRRMFRDWLRSRAAALEGGAL